jgi:hypothetical protein
MDPRSAILGLFPVWCFFRCELSARCFLAGFLRLVIWRVFLRSRPYICLRQYGNCAMQTPWHKLVPFTPGNSSLSDTGLTANKEDLRKFQLENVERELSMIKLNIILFLHQALFY